MGISISICVGVSSSQIPSDVTTPVEDFHILTEDGNDLITESGDKVTQE